MTRARVPLWLAILAVPALAGAAHAQGGKAPTAAAPAADTGGLQWAPGTGGAVPSGAQPTGYDPGGFLFTCRAQVESGTHPGKMRPGLAGCYVPLGGREVPVQQYEVLMGSGYTWVVSRDGTIPAGAVEGGRTRTAQQLYICRAAAYDGRAAMLVPGKTGAGLRGCNVGFDSREITAAMYEVLVRR